MNANILIYIRVLIVLSNVVNSYTGLLVLMNSIKMSANAIIFFSGTHKRIHVTSTVKMEFLLRNLKENTPDHNVNANREQFGILKL